jgi:hypothetical protein
MRVEPIDDAPAMIDAVARTTAPGQIVPLLGTADEHDLTAE